MRAPELTDRVQKNAMLLHDEDSLAAYLEMFDRWPTYQAALRENLEGVADIRRELFAHRIKQQRGKAKANNEKVSRRAVLAYTDANLYLVWASQQIAREEAGELEAPRCSCERPAYNIIAGAMVCSSCNRRAPDA